MFQDSLVGSGAAARKTWSFAVSLLAQTAAICAALLATMAYTPLLPAAGFAVWLEAPPPPPGAPPPPPEQVEAVLRPERFDDAFVQPAKIPERVAMLVDPEETPRIEAPQGAVVGASGPYVENAVIGAIAISVPQAIENPKAKPEPRAPEPPPAGPVAIASTIQAAKLIRRVQPAYPPLARNASVSGTVRLQAIISGDGTIEQLNVLSGHPLLISAAVQAVKQWRYRPTMLNGKAVQVATEIEVNFVLNR